MIPWEINKSVEIWLISQRSRKQQNRKKSWIHQFKSQQGLIWAETRPPAKFGGNLFGSFCLILITNQQTDRQTDTGENKTSPAEVIIIIQQDNMM